MIVRVDRITGQTNNLQQWRDNANHTLAFVDKDGRFFGNLAGTILPAITVNSSGAAEANRVAIQAAVDVALPGAVIRVANDTFYANQVNIAAEHSGITI